MRLKLEIFGRNAQRNIWQKNKLSKSAKMPHANCQHDGGKAMFGLFFFFCSCKAWALGSHWVVPEFSATLDNFTTTTKNLFH